jgi:hypothetical protein
MIAISGKSWTVLLVPPAVLLTPLPAEVLLGALALRAAFATMGVSQLAEALLGADLAEFGWPMLGELSLAGGVFLLAIRFWAFGTHSDHSENFSTLSSMGEATPSKIASGQSAENSMPSKEGVDMSTEKSRTSDKTLLGRA